MTNLIQNFEKTIPFIVNPENNLLDYLFTDKKAIYIEDINFNTSGDFEVAYCFEYTLQMGRPNWIDIVVKRRILIDFIRSERLNHWEAFGYDHHSGSVQPFTNVINDIDAFLDEYYPEIIKEWLTR